MVVHKIHKDLNKAPNEPNYLCSLNKLIRKEWLENLECVFGNKDDCKVKKRGHSFMTK